MGEPFNRWSPKEVRKTFLLLVSTLLFGAGIFLLYSQTKAEGSINIKSSILTGNIKSGSAGLFICFFAAFLMIFSINQPRKVDLARESKLIGNKKFLPLLLCAVIILFLYTTYIFFPEARSIALLLIGVTIYPSTKLLIDAK